MLITFPAIAQHPPQHQQLHNEFYNKWMRPQGHYQGMQHRKSSCCNLSDCFPVLETKMVNGKYFVRPDQPYFNDKSQIPWYPVPNEIIESNQPDPRETPDGRSHVCIIGGNVVCFVEGNGT